MKKTITSTLCALALLSCDIIDYHPYDVRIEGQTNVNTNNIELIESLLKDKDTIRFAAMGDSQRWYDELHDFVQHINQQNNIDFVIHGGDMSDFGITDEFLIQRDILNNLNIPYVALIGNHDCLGTGEYTYRNVFGNPNFSFIAGKTKFLCLNTNALEYDYSRPIPDFNFIEQELNDTSSKYNKTVVAMHAAPYEDVFNNNTAKVFQLYIRQLKNIQFCIAAHEHAYRAEDIFDDGIIYYISDCMKHRNYNLFTITKEGYSHEQIYF